MKKPFIEIDSGNFIFKDFETKPIEGYETPTNNETGEQFPNCCPFHRDIFETSNKWFEIFPNCCESHKAMVSKWWFNKSNYSGIAEKIVKQVSYTEHHILTQVNIDNWYKDITDYIEYNVSSFGHPAIGLHLYLGNVQHWINTQKSGIPKYKKQRLIEFIETYYDNPKDDKKTDLNILYNTYAKWLNVFPFEISFFKDLKPYFEKSFPLLNGKPEINKYSKIAKYKAHTKNSLIDLLLSLTNSLISQINTSTLHEKGLLTEPQKIKLELVLNERKMKLNEGYLNKSQNEGQRYRNILKEWFEDEKRFIDEITPLVKALPPQPIKTKADILTEKLSQYGFFELPKVKSLSKQNAISLIEKVSESSLPYAIAMLDYLQFISYLEKKHFNNKSALNKEVSKWFDSDKDGRSVKGNISSLLDYTTEDKERYTAHRHKETVIKDYELLK